MRLLELVLDPLHHVVDRARRRTSATRSARRRKISWNCSDVTLPDADLGLDAAEERLLDDASRDRGSSRTRRRDRTGSGSFGRAAIARKSTRRSSGDDPAVQQVGRRDALAAEVVDDQEAVVRRASGPAPCRRVVVGLNWRSSMSMRELAADHEARAAGSAPSGCRPWSPPAPSTRSCVCGSSKTVIICPSTSTAYGTQIGLLAEEVGQLLGDRRLAGARSGRRGRSRGRTMTDVPSLAPASGRRARARGTPPRRPAECTTMSPHGLLFTRST